MFPDGLTSVDSRTCPKLSIRQRYNYLEYLLPSGQVPGFNGNSKRPELIEGIKPKAFQYTHQRMRNTIGLCDTKSQIHFPEGNPLLIRTSSEERRRRGYVEDEEEAKLYWLIRNQIRRPQSSLQPIRDTKKEIRGNILIGFGSCL